MRRPQVKSDVVLDAWRRMATRGCTYAQVAELLGMGSRAVEKAVHRARERGDRRAISNVGYIDFRAIGALGAERRWPRRIRDE